MKSHKEDAKQKRFLKIKEAMVKPENTDAFLDRLVCGIFQAFNAVPDEAKSKMPVLNETELAATKSLAGSAFKLLNPADFKAQSKHFQKGFVIGMFLEGEDSIKRQIKTPEEEKELQSKIFPLLRFGEEVNDESIEKYNQLMEHFRQQYSASAKLPKDEYDLFTEGYSTAKKFFAIQELPLEEVDDRQQINFLVLFLGNLAKGFRNSLELEEFAKTKTHLKLQNSPDATKKSLNKIHWKGSRHSRSTRSKKTVDRTKKRSPVK